MHIETKFYSQYIIYNNLNLIKGELDKIHKIGIKKQTIYKVKSHFLGKKSLLNINIKKIPYMSNEYKSKIGKLIIDIRKQVSQIVNQSNLIINKNKDHNNISIQLDVTAPGIKQIIGSSHPVSIIKSKINKTLKNLGFNSVFGPQIEHDCLNFKTLNISNDHPAKNLQDTFYISKNILLRTHTSPVQIRQMVKNKFPIRIITSGPVYRKDQDLTHSPMFHQTEGLFIDKNISFSNLKETIDIFLKSIFSKKIKIRLRPSFFPFTEPSVEIDITCFACIKTNKCQICKGSNWIEIMGAGMVHPKVLLNAGIHPTKYKGFAFGVGIERVAMLKYGVTNIRHFYENNLKFIRQF